MAAARAAGVKGLSRQAFAIGPRIFEAERAIRDGWALYEVHPEVSFASSWTPGPWPGPRPGSRRASTSCCRTHRRCSRTGLPAAINV